MVLSTRWTTSAAGTRFILYYKFQGTFFFVCGLCVFFFWFKGFELVSMCAFISMFSYHVSFIITVHSAPTLRNHMVIVPIIAAVCVLQFFGFGFLNSLSNKKALTWLGVG